MPRGTQSEYWKFVSAVAKSIAEYGPVGPVAVVCIGTFALICFASGSELTLLIRSVTVILLFTIFCIFELTRERAKVLGERAKVQEAMRRGRVKKAVLRERRQLPAAPVVELPVELEEPAEPQRTW
jgi:hypothetical protein